MGWAGGVTCGTLVLIGAVARRREAVTGVVVARVASTRERARRVGAARMRVAVVRVVCSRGRSGRSVLCHLIFPFCFIALKPRVE